MTSAPYAVSVVVPTYNERGNIRPLVERVCAALPPENTEILIVDDNSPDKTAHVVDQLSDRFPVRCLLRQTERGLATAVIHGLRHAAGDRIIVMDADLSHPPESLPALLAALDDPNVQMSIGSRFVPGGSVDLEWPRYRRANAYVARLLARPLTSVRDPMAGFFCVRREGLNTQNLRPVGYKIALELIVRHGWTNIVEIPIRFTDRAAGQTKLSLTEQLRYIRHLTRLYTFNLTRLFRSRS